MFFSFPNRHVRQGRTSNRRWMLCRQVYFAWCAAAAVAEFLTCRHRNDCSSKSLSETHKNEKSQSVYACLGSLFMFPNVSKRTCSTRQLVYLFETSGSEIKKPQGKCSLKLQQAKLIWISSFFWYIPVDLQVSKIPLRSFLWLLLDANSEGQGMLQKTLKSTNKWLQLAEVIADS